MEKVPAALIAWESGIKKPGGGDSCRVFLSIIINSDEVKRELFSSLFYDFMVLSPVILPIGKRLILIDR